MGWFVEDGSLFHGLEDSYMSRSIPFAKQLPYQPSPLLKSISPTSPYSKDLIFLYRLPVQAIGGCHYKIPPRSFCSLSSFPDLANAPPPLLPALHNPHPLNRPLFNDNLRHNLLLVSHSIPFSQPRGISTSTPSAGTNPRNRRVPAPPRTKGCKCLHVVEG